MTNVRMDLTNFKDVIDDLFNNFSGWHEGSIKEPNANLKDGILTLTWDLPGAGKDQIEMDTEDNIIIVRGIEGRYKNLQSKVRVNREYILNHAEASLKDGVLKVQVPKGKSVSTNKIQIK